MKNRLFRSRSLVITAVSLVFVTSCSAGTGDVPPAPKAEGLNRQWVDEILSASREDSFEHQVLGDYWVTDEELQEGMDRFQECCVSIGMTGVLEIHGQMIGIDMSEEDRRRIRASTPEGDLMDMESEAQARVAECAERTGASVTAMAYGMLRSNPEGLSLNDATRRCFAEAGRDDIAVLDDAAIDELRTSAGPDDPLAPCLTFPSYGNSPEE